MTLNIFFFTITIKKRTVSLEAALQEEMVNKLYDQAKERAHTMHRIL